MNSKEKLFLILAGTFFASLVMANILGISKFWSFFGIGLPIGIIPYPLTFLATDLISELYGKSRANYVVFVGLILNVFLVVTCTLAFYAPTDPAWLANMPEGAEKVYNSVYDLMIRGTFASMLAYLLAQFIDVRIFHAIKKRTAGKHLWLRNNASTMLSQLIDSTAVILVTFLGVLDAATLFTYIVSAYVFKLCFALADTPLFYLGVKYLKPIANNELTKGIR
jgi:hypothetical protein